MGTTRVLQQGPCARVAAWTRSAWQARHVTAFAHEQGSSAEGWDNYGEKESSNDTTSWVEVKIDSVRTAQGSSVVFLRLLDDRGLVLPVHIGEHESTSLMKEVNKQKSLRPSTHDLAKNILIATGVRVTEVRIHDVVQNTFYARVFLVRVNASGHVEPNSAVDIDARPSDAINLAVRFGAPMYVHRRLTNMGHPAQQLEVHLNPDGGATITTKGASSTGSGSGISSVSLSGETQTDIARSVQDVINAYDDPTVIVQLQKDLAIREQRYEDAQKLQAAITGEMMHNATLRLVVAMEAALADGRYEEAARLRDEYKRLVAAMSDKHA